MNTPHNMWRLSGLALLLTFGLLASSCACGPCGGDEDGGSNESGDEGGGDGEQSEKAQAAGALADLVPAGADVAVFVTNWEDTLKALKMAEKKFGKDNFPVTESFKEFAKDTNIDPNDPDSLKENGLDPAGSFGFVYIDETLLMLMPLDDEDTFLDSLKKEAKEDDEVEDKLHEQDVDGTTLYSMLKKGSKKPKGDNIQFAWVAKNGVAVVYPGADNDFPGDGIAILKDIAKLKDSKALSNSKDYKDLKEKLGDNLLYAYVNIPSLLKQEAKRSPSDADTLGKVAQRTGWLGLGMTVNDKGLTSRVFAFGDKDTVKALTKVLTAKADFSNVADAIDGKPAIIVRLSQDPKAILDEIGKFDPSLKKDISGGLKEAKQGLGVDFKKDVFPNLDGNTMLVITGGKAGDIMNFDIERLLEKGHAVIAIGLKDSKAINGVLGKVGKKMGIKGKKAGKTTVYSLGKGKAAMTLVVGKKMAVIGSAKILDDLKNMAQGKGAGPKGPFAKGVAKDLLSGKAGIGVAVDVKKILKLMGDAAKGPEGEALKEIGSWSINIKPADKGFEINVDVRFK